MGAGAVAGVAALAGGAAAARTAHADEAAPAAGAAYECDVVVAGAGVGGLAAAVAAVEAGANTILVEASAHVGGTSRFAAGALGPRFGTDWNAVYAKVPLSDPDLGKAVCVNWDDTVTWINGLGLTTEQLSPGSSYLWMGGRRPQEQGSKSYTDEYLQQFGQIFNDKGGTTLLSTKAIDLVLDEAGTPTGLVCCGPDGAHFTISAKQVVLATGGFQCNKEMMVRYLGRFADVSQAQCIPYLDGAGIIMAQHAGAKLSKGFGAYYGHPQPWPQASYCTYDTPEAYEACENIDDVHMAYYGATVHAIQTLGIYTNCDGKRFVNESLTSSLVNQEIMQQFYCRAYLFFDEAAHQTMIETAYCNAAVVGGDRAGEFLPRAADPLLRVGERGAVVGQPQPPNVRPRGQARALGKEAVHLFPELFLHRVVAVHPLGDHQVRVPREFSDRRDGQRVGAVADGKRPARAVEHLLRLDPPPVRQRHRLPRVQRAVERFGDSERLGLLRVEDRLAGHPHPVAVAGDAVLEEEAGDGQAVPAVQRVPGAQLDELDRVGHRRDHHQGGHDVPQAGRPRDRERGGLAAVARREQQPGQPGDMVGVVVGDQQGVQPAQPAPGRPQRELGPLAAVNEQRAALVFHPAAGEPAVPQRHEAARPRQTDRQHPNSPFLRGYSYYSTAGGGLSSRG